MASEGLGGWVVRKQLVEFSKILSRSFKFFLSRRQFWQKSRPRRIWTGKHSKLQSLCRVVISSTHLPAQNIWQPRSMTRGFPGFVVKVASPLQCTRTCFLDLHNFYHCFICGFSIRCAPQTGLLENGNIQLYNCTLSAVSAPILLKNQESSDKEVDV